MNTKKVQESDSDTDSMVGNLHFDFVLVFFSVECVLLFTHIGRESLSKRSVLKKLTLAHVQKYISLLLLCPSY